MELNQVIAELTPEQREDLLAFAKRMATKKPPEDALGHLKKAFTPKRKP